MSQKSIFKLCLIIALATSASAAYGTATTIGGNTPMGGGTYSPSNKVIVSYDSGPASSNASTYAARSKHAAGDREIATNNTDPKLWWKPVTVSSTVTAATSTDTFSSAAWTSM